MKRFYDALIVFACLGLAYILLSVSWGLITIVHISKLID
jgi:hypothetical protein